MCLGPEGLVPSGAAYLAGWQQCLYPAGKALGRGSVAWGGHDPTGIAFSAGWQDCLDPAGMALGRLGGAVCLDPAGPDPTGIAYLGWGGR